MTAQPEPSDQVSSYREWTIATDIAAVAVLSTTLLVTDDEDEELGINLIGGIAIGATLFGTPIIHAAHGHWKRAALSYALRGAAVSVGGFLSIGCKSDECMVGLVLGSYATASAIDAIFMTDERRTATRPLPTIAPRSDGVTVGFATSF